MAVLSSLRGRCERTVDTVDVWTTRSPLPPALLLLLCEQAVDDDDGESSDADDDDEQEKYTDVIGPFFRFFFEGGEENPRLNSHR